MVEITTTKKCEILFLNSHPKGPKMSISEIADFLSINENIVASICTDELDWTLINKELALANGNEKINVTSTSSNYGEEDEYDNLTNGSTTDENRFDDLDDKYYSTKKEKDVDYYKQFSFASLFNLKSYFAERRFNRTSSLSDKDLVIIVCCVSAMLFYLVCPFRVFLMGGGRTVRISREQWIHVCKIDFFEHLEEHLEINKSKANILLGAVDKFYSKHFTEDKHRQLLRSIEYQKRLKEHLEPLKRDFTVYDYTYHIPEYTIAQSIHALLIEIDDLCGKHVHSNSHHDNIRHNHDD